MFFCKFVNKWIKILVSETAKFLWDLYFILQGSVEIYREKNDALIHLSQMHKGEIIGLFTCLNNRPRTASARASTTVVAKKILYDTIQKSIGEKPKWLLTILKEYQIRLDNLSNNYVDQTLELETQSYNIISPVYDGKILASTLITLAKLKHIQVDEIKYVVVNDMIELCAEALDMEKEKVSILLQAILNAGLLIKTKEQDRNREVIPLQQVEKLADFPAFIKSTKLKKIKKLVDYVYSDKQIRSILGLVRYAKQRGLKTTAQVTLDSNDLEKNMEKVVGIKFEVANILDFETLKLIDLEDKEDDKSCKIKFVPAKLGRTMAHIIAYRKLKKIDYSKLIKPNDFE